MAILSVRLFMFARIVGAWRIGIRHSDKRARIALTIRHGLVGIAVRFEAAVHKAHGLQQGSQLSGPGRQRQIPSFFGFGGTGVKECRMPGSDDAIERACLHCHPLTR